MITLSKECLTPMQNISVARVFLNILGYKLDDTEFDYDSTMDIYDKNNHVCGFLQYTIDKVYIYAKGLEASYSNPEVFSISDTECGNNSYKYWTIILNFILNLDNNNTLHGKCHFNAHSDTELGNIITCHPNLKIQNCDLGNVDINILSSGKFIGVNIQNGDKNEFIEVRPISSFSSIMKHIITEGKKQNHFLYPRYSSTVIRNNDNHFEASKLSYIDKHTIENFNKLFSKPSEQQYIKIGLLMNDINPDMSIRLRDISQFLRYNDTPIFDNFISASLDNFSNNEIKLLFGIEKRNDIFQDNNNTLSDSYFNINKKGDKKKEKKLK